MALLHFVLWMSWWKVRGRTRRFLPRAPLVLTERGWVLRKPWSWAKSMAFCAICKEEHVVSQHKSWFWTFQQLLRQNTWWYLGKQCVVLFQKRARFWFPAQIFAFCIRANRLGCNGDDEKHIYALAGGFCEQRPSVVHNNRFHPFEWKGSEPCRCRRPVAFRSGLKHVFEELHQARSNLLMFAVFSSSKFAFTSNIFSIKLQRPALSRRFWKHQSRAKRKRQSSWTCRTSTVRTWTRWTLRIRWRPGSNNFWEVWGICFASF